MRADIRRSAVVIVVEIWNNYASVVARTEWIKREFPITVMSVIYWNTFDSVSLRAGIGIDVAVEQVVIEIIGWVMVWIRDTVFSIIGDM